MFVICGEEMSLNQIKHQYVRGLFVEERVHFALAAPVDGFPMLRNEVYTGAVINLLLEDDVHRYIRLNNNVQINRDAKTVTLSPLFKWFGIDFVKRYGNHDTSLVKYNMRDRAVMKFLSAYMADYRKFLLYGDYTIVYTTCDWKIKWKEGDA